MTVTTGDAGSPSGWTDDGGGRAPVVGAVGIGRKHVYLGSSLLFFYFSKPPISCLRRIHASVLSWTGGHRLVDVDFDVPRSSDGGRFFVMVIDSDITN